MELRIENSRRFDLLSSDLAEISRALDSELADDRRFRSWVGPMDLSRFETDFFDEREAFEMTEYLMKRLTTFGHLPALVLKLEAHYREAKNGGDEYWRFALKSQQDRLAKTVRGVPPANELERQLRNVRRGIERASESLEVESNIVNQLRTLLARLSVKIKKPGGLKRNETPEVAVGNFVEEVSLRMNAIYNKMLNLEDEEANIDHKIRLREYVDGIIKETRQALLNVEEKEQTSKSSVATYAKPSADVIESGSGKKRKASSSESTRDDGEKPGEKGTEKNKFDTVEITKAKLTLVIEAAKESGNKLRILVPNEGKLKASFEPKWKGVLEKMGFSGSAEFVTYEELKRTTDAETPLIVFRGMNTHGNLWDRKKFNNVVVVDMAPVLIMNSL